MAQNFDVAVDSNVTSELLAEEPTQSGHVEFDERHPLSARHIETPSAEVRVWISWAEFR